MEFSKGGLVGKLSDSDCKLVYEGSYLPEGLVKKYGTKFMEAINNPNSEDCFIYNLFRKSIQKENTMRKSKEMPSTRSVLDFIRCDICGAQTTDETAWPEHSPEFMEDYDCFRTPINEVSPLKWKEGGYYHHDGGSFEQIHVDICPKCFLTKLVPWLESQGVKINKKEIDF